MNTIQLSDQTYHRLERLAQGQTQTPDQIAERILKEYLEADETLIEIVERPGGPSAMIKGTRVAVSDIISYLRIGETPTTIVENILPHVTLAQVHAALTYYDHHTEEIDRELAENTEESSRAYLREHLGDEGYRTLTGQK